jgi:hypothetical protein
MGLVLAAMAGLIVQKRLWIAPRMAGLASPGEALGLYYGSVPLRVAMLTLAILFALPWSAQLRLGAAQAVEAGAIIKAATSADRKLISCVNVFDIFEGASVGEGKKSVAIEVLIQPTDKTLTDEDFDALTKKIVGNVEKSTGGALRA